MFLHVAYSRRKEKASPTSARLLGSRNIQVALNLAKVGLGKGGEKFLVQCKQWRAFKVGVEVVRELYGVMAAKGAAGGFVVTSGRFTDEAAAFARSSTSPACPRCSKPMVKRLAKRGANVGGEFWGCTGYPACKGMSAAT